MTMSRDLLLRSLAGLKPRLEAEGVIHLALLGSRARADERPESDVDVVIDVRPDVRFSLLDLVGVAQEIEREVALSANVLMRRSLDSEFLAAFERDAISVF
jgi:predicted nucleotidyltransferase